MAGETFCQRLIGKFVVPHSGGQKTLRTLAQSCVSAVIPQRPCSITAESQNSQKYPEAISHDSDARKKVNAIISH
jgi:hypothetical protein